MGCRGEPRWTVRGRDALAVVSAQGKGRGGRREGTVGAEEREGKEVGGHTEEWEKTALCE